MCAADHLDSEAWRILPDAFKDWFGESGVVVPIHADGRHLGAVLLTFDTNRRLTQTETEFCAVSGRILGSALYRWQVVSRERELGALEERRRLSDELHDELSQQVASLGLLVETMKLDVSGGDTNIVEDIHQLDRRVVQLRNNSAIRCSACVPTLRCQMVLPWWIKCVHMSTSSSSNGRSPYLSAVLLRTTWVTSRRSGWALSWVRPRRAGG